MGKQEPAFEARVSQWRMVPIIVMAAAFVVLSLVLIGLLDVGLTPRRVPPVLMTVSGWVGLLFFGLGTVILVRRMFDQRVRLRVDAAGVFWLQFSDEVIEWRHIRSVDSWHHRGQKMIILALADDAPFERGPVEGWVDGANAVLTGGEVVISLIGLDKSYGAAWAAIETWHPHTTEAN